MKQVKIVPNSQIRKRDRLDKTEILVDGMVIFTMTKYYYTDQVIQLLEKLKNLVDYESKRRHQVSVNVYCAKDWGINDFIIHLEQLINNTRRWM